MPARAAIASSDDDKMIPSTMPSKARKSDMALAAVDLTKPLGSDEELHVAKPYKVRLSFASFASFCFGEYMKLKGNEIMERSQVERMYYC